MTRDFIASIIAPLLLSCSSADTGSAVPAPAQEAASDTSLPDTQIPAAIAAGGTSSIASGGGASGSAADPAQAGQTGAGQAGVGGSEAAPDEPVTEPLQEFTCTHLYGGSRDELWYDLFEPQVDGNQFQGVFLSGSNGGFIEGWARPDNPDFARPPVSPCSSLSSAPDRVVFTLAGWMEESQQEFYEHITSIVLQVMEQFPSVQRIELATAVRSFDNEICNNDIKTTILPETDAAIEQVVTDYPGLVFVGSKFESPDCSYFSGHNVTPEGAIGFAQQAVAYYFGDGI